MYMYMYKETYGDVQEKEMGCMEGRVLYLLECISPEFGMPDGVSPLERECVAGGTSKQKVKAPKTL